MAKQDLYIQELYKVLSYSNEQFDKNVLFIASGALGVSFAFIDKLIPDMEKAVSKNSLINAWYCFAAVIFISLVSHFISSISIRWSINNYEKDNFEKGMRLWNWLIRSLNVLMVIGLFTGTILLINFIQLNL